MKKFILLFVILSVTAFSQDSIRYSSKRLDSLAYQINLKKYPQNKFFIFAGGVFADVAGSVVVNNSVLGLGTKLDFTDNLKLDRNVTTFRVAAQYNLSRKSIFTASYMLLKQKSDVTLTDSIKFGNQVYDANTNFHFEFDFSYFGLNYCYNIVAKPQFQTGVTAGIRLFGIHPSGNGIASVNGEQAEKSSDSKLLAPGLLLGMSNTVYFLPNLINRTSLEYFQVKISSISVNLFEGRIGLEYYFVKNIGVGFLAFANVLKVVSDSQEDFNGEVNYSFKGLSLYVAVRF
jgi:hypothetical protein